jgi:hypothetical protein
MGAKRRSREVNVLDLLGKIGIKIDLSGMFATPAPPPVITPALESPAVAAMNADVEKAIDQ